MSIVDLIFPKICVGCSREGNYICDSCQEKLVKPEQICPGCCKPSLDGWTHPRCRQKYKMERLIVALSYHGMVQKCLKKIKYKSSWDIIQFLEKLCKWPVIEAGLVTSVPMWRIKEKTRGFNQAELIAKLIAKDFELPYLASLERVKETRPMFGLTRKERQANIEGAFMLIDQCQIDKVTRVILVDDVWTTGATMSECASVLKRSGRVGEVWGVALAR